VRIMPYRTQDNRINGLVLTFIDITTIKKLENSMQEALSVLQVKIDDQSLVVEDTLLLTDVLKKTRIILEKSFKGQANDLTDEQIELQTQMKRIL